MKDIVRGISIHTTSDGLQYYVHYDVKGTIMVNEKEYQAAFQELQKWKEKVSRIS